MPGTLGRLIYGQGEYNIVAVTITDPKLKDQMTENCEGNLVPRLEHLSAPAWCEEAVA